MDSEQDDLTDVVQWNRGYSAGYWDGLNKYSLEHSQSVRELAEQRDLYKAEAGHRWTELLDALSERDEWKARWKATVDTADSWANERDQWMNAYSLSEQGLDEAMKLVDEWIGASPELDPVAAYFGRRLANALGMKVD